MPPAPDTDPHAEQQALQDALRAVLGPLARLAVARGLPYAVIDDLLKQALVDAAARQHPHVAPHRSVSRISTATGINRREVTRLTQPEAAAAARRPVRSLASEVFTHWLGDRAYCQRDGTPRSLPRQGPAPSFETLAQSVTRDVHPRSLLDELLRLRLAVLDEHGDRVTLLREGFVPREDRVRMLGFLADNVGDHLSAAVANVVGEDRPHFEQALFADGLSEASMEEVRRLVGAQWKLLLQALVPPLEALVAADEQRPADTPRRRLRIGLFGYDEAVGAAPAAPAADATPPPPKRRSRTR